MRPDLLKRLKKVEARADKGVNLALVLVEYRYRPACIYNRGQLEDLGRQDNLAGRVARGLLRIRRYAEGTPPAALPK